MANSRFQNLSSRTPGLCCPLSGAIFLEPVKLKTGATWQVFEKQALEKWVNLNQTHPFSGEPLTLADINLKDNLQPAEEMRAAVTAFLSIVPERRAEQYVPQTPSIQQSKPATDARVKDFIDEICSIERSHVTGELSPPRFRGTGISAPFRPNILHTNPALGRATHVILGYEAIGRAAVD